ncbi:AbrB family transcriptional regulator [Acidovorax sp. 210-6]|uniref:AbrB family transcriptional regulator n=1 Tax=Acidovorax sp. 210-6 TaxID=2699468 RepID=UPI001F5B95E3|nr:AbrB family transcriptional regulator [Acidovorax sp. 210-6]
MTSSRHWLALCMGSALLSAALLALHVPAAVLLGCMVCAIAVAVRGTTLAVPRTLFGWGQGLLGCLMAHSLQPQHLGTVVQSWPVFLGATLLLIAASTGLGWWLTRRQVMPGTTALWGMAPGAATAMVVMSESFGADVRLVAFMQYTRVVVVTLVAALVTRAVVGPLPDSASAIPWWPPTAPQALALTAALVLGGHALAQRLNLAGGSMVLPLVAAALVQGLWDWTPALPPALMALAYAAIGWSVGLRFTRGIALHALRALPQVLLSIALLMGVGLATGTALVLTTGLDALSAFLATCPGGADSMAVIAATSAVDTGFVMAMQLARFLVVLVAGPAVTRRVAQGSAQAGPPPL